MCRIFVVSQEEEKWRFLKDALWGATGAGLVDGGVDQGPWLQERVRGGWQFQRRGGLGLGWLFQRGASPGKGWFRKGRCVIFRNLEVCLVLGVREGLAWRGKGSGGVQGLRFRGAEQISQRVSYFYRF